MRETNYERRRDPKFLIKKYIKRLNDLISNFCLRGLILTLSLLTTYHSASNLSQSLLLNSNSDLEKEYNSAELDDSKVLKISKNGFSSTSFPLISITKIILHLQKQTKLFFLSYHSSS